MIRYISYPAQCMMTLSNGNIFRVTGPFCGEFTVPGEFPAQRPCIMHKIMEGDRISLRFKLHKTKLPTSSDMEPPLQVLFNFNLSMGK